MGSYCGFPVADGVCENSNPKYCIDANPLGEEDVGVCILNSLDLLEVPPSWRFSLRRWSLRIVLHDGINLWNHLCRYEEIQKALLATMRPRIGYYKYDSIRVPREPTQCHRDQILEETSIRSVATKDCCAKRYCQLLPRDKVKSLRQEMWLRNFCMRSAKKLEVHGNMHFNAKGRKVVTLENIEVCCTAWYIIHAVSKAEFYGFQNYLLQGQCSWFHGNFGTKKPRVATLQVAATLSTIIMPLADAMPYKTRTLPSGENVVQMVLPTGTKWKNILMDVNEIGEKTGCGPISLSKLSVIKNQQFT